MRRLPALFLWMLLLSESAFADTSTPPKILHTWWFSHYEQLSRRVDIYMPDGCEDMERSGKRLPVLYLIHGINGHEGAWQERGNAVDTLARMIAEGRCEPMILVMPDCNLWPVEERPLSRGNRFQCIMGYSALSHEHILEYAVSDLMTMMDTTYATSDQCAVAGLSDGARIAANIANLRPDRIRSVGLFSPVLHKEQVPQDPTQQVSIYVGKSDFFKPNGKRLHRRMTKAGHPHAYIEIPRNHDWPVWRKCLSEFLKTLNG